MIRAYSSPASSISRVVDHVVDRAPGERLLRRVLAGQEEDLAGPLLPHLPGQQRGAVPAVERADVGVGLHEPGVLAAGDAEVRDDVQRVPAAGRPAVDQRDDDLRHGPDQPLHLEDVQAPGARRVDRRRAVSPDAYW